MKEKQIFNDQIFWDIMKGFFPSSACRVQYYSYWPIMCLCEASKPSMQKHVPSQSVAGLRPDSGRLRQRIWAGSIYWVSRRLGRCLIKSPKSNKNSVASSSTSPQRNHSNPNPNHSHYKSCFFPSLFMVGRESHFFFFFLNYQSLSSLPEPVNIQLRQQSLTYTLSVLFFSCCFFLLLLLMLIVTVAHSQRRMTFRSHLYTKRRKVW